MNTTLLFGAALIALFALALPALASQFSFRVDWRDLVRSELGVQVLYCFPGAPLTGLPSTTPPVAGTAVHLQTALVTIGDTETQATIVTNWGGLFPSPTLAPGWLFPVVDVRQTDAYAAGGSLGTNITAFTFDISNTNQVVMYKKSATGSGGQFAVTLQMPSTLVR